MADYRVIDVEQLESDLTVVAEAIREKGGASGPLEFPNGMADAVRGIQSGADYLQYMNSVTITNLDLFNEENLVLNLYNATSLYNMTNKANNTKVKSITINCSNQITAANYAFAKNNTPSDSVLESITLNVDFSKCTRMDYFLAGQTAFIEILGTPFDLSSATNVGGIFNSCQSLVEVRFVKNTIKLSISFNRCESLSNESIQSIIDGLADLTGQTAQTITFHADIEAKLSDEQKAQITSKNWTLAFSK